MYNYSGREEPFLIIYLQLSFVITSNQWRGIHDVLIPSLSRIQDVEEIFGEFYLGPRLLIAHCCG